MKNFIRIKFFHRRNVETYYFLGNKDIYLNRVEENLK